MSKEIDLILRLRDEATARMRSVEAQFKSSMGAIKGLVVGAISVQAFKSFIEESNQAEVAVAQLGQAMRNAGVDSKEATEEMLAFSSAMQKVTVFSDETVTEVQTMIVAMTGMTGKAVQPLTKAILDLSSGLGKDATDIAVLVGKTLEGSDALGKLGISTKDATTQTEKLNMIIDGAREKFGGFAENEARTTAGQMKILANTFGELEEKIGDEIKTLLKDLIPMFQVLAEVAIPALTTALNVAKIAFLNMFAAILAPLAAVEMGLNNLGVTTSKTLQYALASYPKLLKEAAGNIVAAWSDETPKIAEAAGKAIEDPVADAVEAAKAKSSELVRTFRMNMNTIALQAERVKEKRVNIMDMEIKAAGVFQMAQVAVNKKTQESIDLISQWHEAAVAVFVDSAFIMRDSIAYAISGGQDAFKQFFRGVVNTVINAAEAIIIANKAAAIGSAFLTFGASLAFLADVAVALAALEGARALLHSFPVGGQVPGATFLGGSNMQAVPIIAHGGETIRTPAQEERLREEQGNSFVFNFNGPVSDVEFIRRGLEKMLRQTGLTIDKVAVNRRSRIALS